VLGGSSYAAVKLGKHSVGSKQIARNAVKASETARQSVGSAEVIDRSLLAKDFRRGQLPAGLVARLDQPATLAHPDLPEERRQQD
jgi:hypothetical protein